MMHYNNPNPHISGIWKVKEHCRNGRFGWNPQRIMLYFSDLQKKGECIEGNAFIEEIRNKQRLNANALGLLLANPKRIPEEWKELTILFPGTIYINELNGRSYVRCLGWDVDEWFWMYCWLGLRFSSSAPVALLAV